MIPDSFYGGENRIYFVKFGQGLGYEEDLCGMSMDSSSMGDSSENNYVSDHAC